ALLHAVSNAESLGLRQQLGYKLVVDLVKEIQPFDGEARLAAVEKPPDRRRAHRFIDVSVVAHNHRIAAAELKRDALYVLRCNFHHMLAGRSGAGKSDLPNASILQ